MTHLESLVLPTGSKSYVDRSSKLNNPHDKDWLAKAQTSIMDTKKTCLSKDLVGKLYGLCFELSEVSDELSKNNQKPKGGKRRKKKELSHAYDVYNEDSIAAGMAYKDAMVSELIHANETDEWQV